MVISGCSLLVNLSNHRCFVSGGKSESTKSPIGWMLSTNCFVALRYPAPIKTVISISLLFNNRVKNQWSDWRNDSTLLAVSADTLLVYTPPSTIKFSFTIFCLQSDPTATSVPAGIHLPIQENHFRILYALPWNSPDLFRRPEYPQVQTGLISGVNVWQL